jgi:tRNA threonylcarbamoyl adenosine modification protein (Sua5/YciO/YrdC/YwlC family)
LYIDWFRIFYRLSKLGSNVLADIVYTYENPVSEKDIEKIVRCLKNDGIIAYPTDVNWAFGALATSKKAIQKLHKLKPDHPKDQPLALVFHNISQISEYAQVDNFAYRHLKKIFPGPYTVILPRAKTLPKQLDDNRKVVGVKIPNKELVIKMLEKLELPIATSSVPVPDDSNSVYGYQIDEKYGHTLDMIVDLGGEISHLESTILDMSEGEINVIREGAGPLDVL